MIFTVTLNPALDKTAVIGGFTPGTVNRITSVRVDPGGKGVNVSKCLSALGTSSVAAMLLGGDAGRQLEGMLSEAKIKVLKVELEGQTRTNLKIIDPDAGANTDINEPGPQVQPAQLEQLKQQILQRLQPGDLVVLSGSLPADAPQTLYRDWCREFQAHGALVLLDADGEALRYGIEAVPYLIKPNDAELSRLMGRPLENEQQLLEAGRELVAKGIRDVIISRGGEGALFLTRKDAFRVKGLQVPVQSTVGAGDSMVAAMAFALEREMSRTEQIGLAMAMSAASVMQSGSQPPSLKTVYDVAQQVVVEEL